MFAQTHFKCAISEIRLKQTRPLLTKCQWSCLFKANFKMRAFEMRLDENGRVCLRRISTLRAHDVRPYAFEIHINAFQNNSFHRKYMVSTNLNFV